MDYLKPPTDNLYKFMAITGVVLLVACILWKRQVVYDTHVRDLEFDREIREQRDKLLTDFDAALQWYRLVDVDLPGLRYPEIDGRIHIRDLSAEDAHEMTTDLSNILLATNYPQSYRRLYEAARQSEARTDIKMYLEQYTIEINRMKKTAGEVEFLKQLPATQSSKVLSLLKTEHALESAFEMKWYLADNVAESSHLSGYGIVTGVIMMAFGFATWYVKVQRYQDAVLQREAGRIPPLRLRFGRLSDFFEEWWLRMQPPQW